MYSCKYSQASIFPCYDRTTDHTMELAVGTNGLIPQGPCKRLFKYGVGSVSTEPTPATDLAQKPTEPEPAIMSITRPEPTARSIPESTPATQPLPEPEKSCIFDLWPMDYFPFSLCWYRLAPRLSSLRW